VAVLVPFSEVAPVVVVETSPEVEVSFPPVVDVAEEVVSLPLVDVLTVKLQKALAEVFAEIISQIWI